MIAFCVSGVRVVCLHMLLQVQLLIFQQNTRV